MSVVSLPVEGPVEGPVEIRVGLRIGLPGLEELSWHGCEATAAAVQIGKQLPAQVLARALFQAQERLVDAACGPRYFPVRHT